MDFDTYVGQLHVLNFISKKDCINEYLVEYTQGGVDIDKIDYDFIDDHVMWYIEPNNDYTKYVFYTEQKILLRKLKLQRLVKNGNGI